MVSKFAILTNILLASGVLAVPSSQLKARLARRHENRQSRANPINRADASDGAAFTDYNGGWSGVALTESEGTFTYVTGTFIVPKLNGSEDSSAAVWLGIDGPTWRDAILQAGVDLVISGGEASYNPWLEWYPAPCEYFSEFNISAGDKIRTTVNASSDTSGTAIIENLTTRQTVTKKVSSSVPIRGQNAEWVIEDFERDIPFVDFGMVKFTNATASGPGSRKYTPDGADIIFELQPDNSATVLTSTSVSGDNVTINRINS